MGWREQGDVRGDVSGFRDNAIAARDRVAWPCLRAQRTDPLKVTVVDVRVHAEQPGEDFAHHVGEVFGERRALPLREQRRGRGPGHRFPHCSLHGVPVYPYTLAASSSRLSHQFLRQLNVSVFEVLVSRCDDSSGSSYKPDPTFTQAPWRYRAVMTRVVPGTKQLQPSPTHLRGIKQ